VRPAYATPLERYVRDADARRLVYDVAALDDRAGDRRATLTDVW
jgi:hypothetical protein